MSLFKTFQSRFGGEDVLIWKVGSVQMRVRFGRHGVRVEQPRQMLEREDVVGCRADSGGLCSAHWLRDPYRDAATSWE